MARAVAARGLFTIVAVAFFATPIAARVLGVTAEQFENRELADPPKLSQGWDAFAQTTRYVTDHMPLRAQAVRANTRIWTDVFDTAPRYVARTAIADDQALPFAGAVKQGAPAARTRAPDAPSVAGEQPSQTGAAAAELVAAQSGVIEGDDGWLFFGSELTRMCDAPPNAFVIRRWTELLQSVRAGGRKAVLIVSPDKALVYPEHLPDEYPSKDCALPSSERFWQALSEVDPAAGIVGLRDELLRLKTFAGGDLFQREDTHWSTLGALVLVEAALDAVGEGVQVDPSEVVTVPRARYRGNLLQLNAENAVDTFADRKIVRRPGAPRVPGSTLLVGDSFAFRWLRLFRPYFERFRSVTIYEADADIVAAIRRADRVLFTGTEGVMKFGAPDNNKAPEIRRLLEQDGR